MAIATASALALGAAAPVLAQTATEETAQETAKEETAKKAPATLQEVEAADGVSNDSLEDAKVRSFVEALAAIQIVGNHYMPKIETASDGTQRAELIDMANSDIVRAIETVANITPAEFKAIDKAAQEDETLNKRIMAEIQVAQAEAAEERAKRAAKEAESKDEETKTE